jgi:hypothetical protein
VSARCFIIIKVVDQDPIFANGEVEDKADSVDNCTLDQSTTVFVCTVESTGAQSVLIIKVVHDQELLVFTV